MKIFNNEIELIDLVVTDESYRYRQLVGENALTLTFSMPVFVDIPVDSYADFQGERYTLLRPKNFKKNNTRDFEYNLVLQSAQGLSSKYKYRDSTSKKLKFQNTAKPIDHLKMWVWNMNQRDSGWSIGECIDATEKLISFSHTYCDEALKMIAEAFNTEFEVVGKVVSIKKVEYNKTIADALPLSYGFGNGFNSGIKRDNFDNSKAIEILFVQGGDKNINVSEYGSAELLLPKNQSLVYEGKTYVSDEFGYSIRRLETEKPLVTKIEDSLDLSNISPQRVGTVSTVTVVDAVNNFYDFADASIPENLNYVTCLIAGEKLTVIFQSGILAGKEFDIAYTHATRNFAIVPQEIDGVTMPSEIFKPVVSDTYAVFGMSLPDSYICDNATKTGSSWDMFREAAKYFYENEDPRFTFSGELDGMWTAQDWVNIGGKIKLGAYAGFRDDQFQTDAVLMRMIGIRDLINDPYSPTIELSNVTVGGNSLSSALKKIDSNEVVAESIKKDTIRFAKRGFRDVKEASELLKKSLLNFSGAINPITVQAMQYIAGDESLQFVFVTNHTTTNETPHSESYDPITKQFSSAVGIIQHRTLGITTLSSSHAASEFKWWNMTAFISARLSESEKSYFVYAKCSKTANTGVFVLSETAIALEGVAGYYHLLMGIINSENENDRSYSQMYGYSEWTPGRFTIKKVASPSGNTFFDLENEVIQGNIKFQSGVTVETGISNAKSEAVQLASNDATTKANNAIQTAKEYSDAKVSVINQTIADLQTQSDGSISNWPSNTQSEAPTLSNFPASQWTSNTERDRHILDVYTNYQEYVSDAATPNAGKSWKFVKSESSVYSWSLIADNNQSKAYLMSVKATAIANQKITTFSTIPNTLMADGFCYRKGDLWSLQVAWNGFTIGELLCAAQDSTSFISGDWTKWVKYTDDTAVNNLQIGAVNLIKGTSKNSSIATPNWIHLPLSAPLIAGKEYILSGEFTFPYETAGFVGINNYDYGNGVILLSHNIPFIATAEMATKGYIAYCNQTGNGVVHVNNLQLELGNKSTAWKEAPEDTQQKIDAANTVANTAVSNAATAQVAANTANSAIANITSDNILSASEKSGERTRWNVSLTEKSGIDTQANTFGITTEKTAYDNAFQALATYLNAGTAYSSGVPLWVDDSNLGTNTSIVGATYRSAWELMMSTRQTLLNAIASKAKILADAAQTQANTVQANLNNLKIGGVNLIKGTSKNSTISVPSWIHLPLSAPLIAGKEYILGGEFAFPDGTSGYVGINNYDYGNGVILLSHNIPFIATAEMATKNYIAYCNQTGNGVVTVNNLKLELGNKSTDYSIAPEDVAADATAKANAATAVANAAQSTIDNLNISTKNLVSGDGSEILVYGYMTYGALMKRGKEYCGTIMAKSDRTVSYNMYFLDSVTGSFASAGITLTTTYQQFSIRGVCPNWWNEGTGILIIYQSNGSIPIWTKEVSVVEGGKPMLAWMASPEYIASKLTALDYLKLAFGGSTEIIGGVVAASVMLLKNLQGVITAGISGLNDNVSYWHGGTYQNALDSANNPSAVSGIDRDDGSGHRAKGKLLWTKEGVLKMLAGFIGNFAIIGGRIVGKDTSGNEKLVLSTDNIPDIDSLSSGYTNCYYNDHSEITDGVMYQFSFFGGDEYGNLKNSDYGIESAEFQVPYATTVKFDRSIVGSYIWTSGSQYVSGISFITYAKVYKNGVYVQDLAEGGVMVVSSACTLRFDIYADMSLSIDYNQYAGCNVTVDIATAISFQEARSKTELGSNGFYSYFTNALVFYISATRGLIYKGKIDIPIGLGGGNVGSGGSYTQGWGLAYSSSRSGATTTINHNVIDPKFTVIIVPRNSFTWYLSATTASSSTTSNNGTATIVCSTTNAIFDFLIVRIS
jgi:predicted small secreted protein